MLPGLRASTAWNGVPGGELGSADAKQWCVPWGFELNNISYNRNLFDKVGVQPPKNLEDMVNVAAKLTKDAGGPYGIGVRGSRSGHHPSGLPFRLLELRPARLHRIRRQVEGRDEYAGIEGLSQAVGADDPGIRDRRTGPPTLGTKSAPISVPAPPP